MYVVYLSCDFVTKMIIKKINLKIWKSSLISGLWFGIVQFLNRNIQAWTSVIPVAPVDTSLWPNGLAWPNFMVAPPSASVSATYT